MTHTFVYISDEPPRRYDGVLFRQPAYAVYRFVVHEHVLDYLNCGWHIAVADLGPPHNNWSVLMQWLCPCEMVEPKR